MATIFRPVRFFRTWLQDPAGSAIRAQGEVLQNSLLLLYSGQDQLPFRQKDWLVPDRIKGAEGVALRAESNVWQNRLLTLLKSQDIIYGGQGQVPDYDWQNPNRLKDERGAAIRALDGVQQNDLSTLLVGKDVLPRNPGHWPNPVLTSDRLGWAVRAEGEVWENRLLNLLVGKDLLPFRQNDWNLLAGKAPQQIILPTNFVLLLEASSPFNKKDWSNPQFSASQNRTFEVGNYNFALLSNNIPFGKLDWSNPQQSQQRLTNVGSYNFALLQQQVQAPFNNLDWPNPVQGNFFKTTGFINPVMPTSPAPPVTNPQYIGFVCNVGRLMGRT